MGCLLSLMKFLLTIAFLIFIISQINNMWNVFGTVLNNM